MRTVRTRRTMHIGDRVRQRMSALGIPDQQELCRRVKAAGGKLSQPQASQLLAGLTKRPRCLPELAVALDTSVAFLLQDEGTGKSTVSSDGPQPAFTETVKPIAVAPDPLVIFFSSAAGTATNGRPGEIIVNKAERVGVVSRPTELRFSKNAFGIMVQDDEAEPRYSRRDTLLVDPSTPPAENDDVVLVRDPAPTELRVLPVRLIRITPSHWVVKRFAHDAKEQRIPRTEFAAAFTIFGTYRRR